MEQWRDAMQSGNSWLGAVVARFRISLMDGAHTAATRFLGTINTILLD